MDLTGVLKPVSASAIPSFWSSNPHPPRKHTRIVDHSVLAKLTKATITNIGKTDLLFGLWNIQSLSSKGPLVYDLFDHKFDFLCSTETGKGVNNFIYFFSI